MYFEGGNIGESHNLLENVELEYKFKTVEKVTRSRDNWLKTVRQSQTQQIKLLATKQWGQAQTPERNYRLRQ